MGRPAYTLDDNTTQAVADENQGSQRSSLVIFPVIEQPDQKIVGVISDAGLARCAVEGRVVPERQDPYIWDVIRQRQKVSWPYSFVSSLPRLDVVAA
jgi:hypothetical protein